MDRLSDKQQAILEFIEDYIEEHDYPPSIRDIQQGCGISSTSVVKYNLDRLSQMGLLSRQAEISRGLVLSGSRSHAEPERVAVPLLGTIAAGSRISWKATATKTCSRARGCSPKARVRPYSTGRMRPARWSMRIR